MSLETEIRSHANRQANDVIAGIENIDLAELVNLYDASKGELQRRNMHWLENRFAEERQGGK